MTNARIWTIATLAGAGIIALLGLALGALIFTTADDQRAIALSAIVAYVVQTAGFAVVRRYRSANMMGAWGLAALLRFIALVVYAFVVIKGTGLPVAAGLFSLVTFFFVTTLAEPWLLRS
jgi:hypothetical protein